MQNKKYYLCFRQAQNKSIKYFLKRDCSHVDLLIQDFDAKKWIAVEPRFNYLDVRVINCDINYKFEQCYKKIHKSKVVLLNDNAIDFKQLNFNFMRLFMCTGSIQYLLNMRYFCLTPYSLYKKILRKSMGRLI